MSPPKTLLLIDDDDGVRDGLAFALEDLGWTVLKAADPFHAILALIDQRPDVAVLDLLLPDFLGDTLLMLLRRHAQQLPAVIITGYPNIISSARLRRIGQIPTLIKPFETEELHRMCGELLASGVEPRVAPVIQVPVSVTMVMTDLALLAESPTDAQLLSHAILSLEHLAKSSALTNPMERLAEATGQIIEALSVQGLLDVDPERVMRGISVLGVALSHCPSQPGQTWHGVQEAHLRVTVKTRYAHIYDRT